MDKGIIFVSSNWCCPWNDDENNPFVDFTKSEEELGDFENSDGKHDPLPIINNSSSLPDLVDRLSLLDNIDDSNSDKYSGDEEVCQVFV